MRAMPRVLAGSGGCRDSGPAGAPVTGICRPRHARGIARMARSYARASENGYGVPGITGIASIGTVGLASSSSR